MNLENWSLFVTMFKVKNSRNQGKLARLHLFFVGILFSIIRSLYGPII